MHASEHEGITKKILALWDHKGTLHIEWLAVPDAEDMETLEQAWWFQDEYNVQHVFPDGREIYTSIGALAIQRIQEK